MPSRAFKTTQQAEAAALRLRNALGALAAGASDGFIRNALAAALGYRNFNQLTAAAVRSAAGEGEGVSRSGLSCGWDTAGDAAGDAAEDAAADTAGVAGRDIADDAYRIVCDLARLPIDPLSPGCTIPLVRRARSITSLSAPVDTLNACERAVRLARERYLDEGRIEVDEGAILSIGDDGVYVQAWVFIDRAYLPEIYHLAWDALPPALQLAIHGGQSAFPGDEGVVGLQIVSPKGEYIQGDEPVEYPGLGHLPSYAVLSVPTAMALIGAIPDLKFGVIKETDIEGPMFI